MVLPGTKLEQGRVVGRVTLVDPRTRGPVPLWRFRQQRALVLCFLHDGCTPCRSFTERLATVRSDLEWAEALPRAIVSEDELGVPVLLDPDGRARREFVSEATSDPVILIVDRYGAAAASFPAPEHGFPEPREVVATVVHMALECPECGVPDWSGEGEVGSRSS